MDAIDQMDRDPKNLEEGTGDMDITLSAPMEMDQHEKKVEEELGTDQLNESDDWLDLNQTVSHQLTQETTTLGIAPKVGSREVHMVEVENHNDTKTTKTDFKLDAGGSIPIWITGNNPRERTENVRTYIRDLKRIRSLKIIKNEALLINASLVKSNKTHLYEELPLEAENNIDEFIKY